jgi:hypothetical protein
MFECLKDGLRNGGSVDWSGSARPAVHGLTAHRLIQKARSGFSGAGLIFATVKICG